MAEDNKTTATEPRAEAPVEVVTEEVKAEVAPEAPAKAAEPAKEEKKPAGAEAKADKEVPAKFKKIVTEIEEMSVLELNELVKVFEDKFGVSATAVAAVAGPAAAAENEKTTASVELADSGANKISVIKVVKEALSLGLKEAKDMVDGAPIMLKADMKKEQPEELKKKIEEAGGKVTLK
jgi:large subunit ribosomal protein L7/L12